MKTTKQVKTRCPSKSGLTTGERRRRRLMERFHKPNVPSDGTKPSTTWVTSVLAGRAKAKAARKVRRIQRRRAG